MAENNNEMLPVGALVDPGKSSRIRKEMDKNRPKAALGNTRTHIMLDDNPEWVTVGRRDLEAILQYIQLLETKTAALLKDEEGC